MLASMRTTAHSIFMKILMVLLVISFAVWGVGDIVRSGNNSYLVKIDDERVTYQEFVQAVNETERMMQQNGINNVDRRLIENQVLRRLVEEKFVKLALRDAGLDVNQQLLAKRVREAQVFHDVRGKFDPETFRSMLAQRNQTETAFLDDLKTEVRASVFVNSLSTEGMAAPLAMASLTQASQNERRDALILTIPASRVEFTAPDEEALRDYYDANASMLYLQPETRTLEYVSFSADALAKQVEAGISDDDIRQRFEDEQDRFVDEDGNSKKLEDVAADIRTELKTERTETAAADLTVEVEDALAAGKSMGEAVADAGIATSSKLLNDVKADQYTESKDALLNAVTNTGYMLEEGETSSLEVADNGAYYMVTVKAINAAAPKAFEAVQADVKQRATLRARAKALRAKADEVKAALEKDGVMEKVAKEFGFTVRSVSNIARRSDGKAQPIGPSLADALFEYEVGGIAGPLVEADKAELAQVKAIRFLPIDAKATSVLAQGLAQAVQQEVLMGYYGDLTRRYKVTMNEKLLEQIQAQQQGEGA